MLYRLPSVFLFIAGLGLSLEARADPPCPDLTPDHGALGFARRTHGDRCEGFYKSNVSGEALSIAFLMSGRLPAATEVEVKSAGPALEIHVRAVPLPLGTYYRMEAIVGPNGVLRWPLAEVVQASQSLKTTDLGLYGWFGATARPTYVPVRVLAPGSPGVGQEPVRLGVRANVPLDRVVYNVTDDESCHFGNQPWTELATNVPSGRVLEIVLRGQGAAACAGFRGKVPNSEDSEPLTARIRLR